MLPMMKNFLEKMKNIKFFKDHIAWGKYSFNGKDDYVYWFYFLPNYLEKNYRYFGYEVYYYDQPIGSFGFWFFNISWSTQWTKYKFD